MKWVDHLTVLATRVGLGGIPSCRYSLPRSPQGRATMSDGEDIITPFARQRIAFVPSHSNNPPNSVKAVVLLSTKPAQLTIPGNRPPTPPVFRLDITSEYLQLLRSQVKRGQVKQPVNLDVISLLKQRISSLEEQNLSLQCNNVTHKRTIEDLDVGSGLLNFRI
jgi:hypothetical protein